MNLIVNQAQLIKRYKRFLADVKTNNGDEFTIHCANTGAMTGCAEPGSIVWYSTLDNAKRKYPNSWEVTQFNNHFICVNTIRANQLVEEALANNSIAEFIDLASIKREVKFGQENSKVDFLVTEPTGDEHYIEVKSVTLLQDNQGYFPDAVTTRGQKHLRELTELTRQGKKATLLFAVLHTGINSVKPACHIDKKYGQLLQEAKEAGVNIIAYKADFAIKEEQCSISLSQSIAVELD